MPKRLSLSVLGVFLTLFAGTTHAAFVPSDFGIVLAGYDSNPPFFDNQGGASYELWLVNNTDQTMVWGENLFGGWVNSISVEIDGVDVNDSQAHLFTNFMISQDEGDGVIDPGEAYYMGGIVFGFDLDLLPPQSTVVLTEFLFRLKNTSAGNDFGFLVPYEGEDIVTTINNVPIPAVGYALIPMVAMMRVFGRRQKRLEQNVR